MSSIEEMRALLDSNEFNVRFEIGLGGPTSHFQFSDRDRLVQSFSMHYSILMVKAELDQMLDGMKTLGVLDLMRSNPKTMRPLFVPGGPVLTTDSMFDLFRGVFSPKGSNQREIEESIIVMWSNYLQLIEGKHIACCVALAIAIVFVDNDGKVVGNHMLINIQNFL